MIEYLLSLSLLIAVVLLIRAVFRKTVSPRVIYALWLVVVVRMLMPITLFEIDVTLPEFLQTEQTEQTEPSEQLPADSQEVTDMLNPSPSTTPVQTTPTYPSPSTSPTVPTYPSVSTPVTPVTPSTPGNEPDAPAIPAEPIPVAPKEPVSVNWKRIADLVWFSGAAAVAIWVIFTSITYNSRLYKDRKLHRTVRGTKVYISESAGVPCIAGLIPSIYITPEAANSKSEMMIIVHEHVHLRHGDHIWSVIRALALIVFWWNPLVWAAGAVSKQDAELACDDAISAKLNEVGRLKYANILLDTIPQKYRYATGLGSAPMKERILMLTTKQKNRWICLILAIVLAVGAVGCAFVHLTDNPDDAASDSRIGIVTENLADFLTEEQIALYEKAGKIYPLFNGTSDGINILHLLLEGASFEEQIEHIAAHQNEDDEIHKIDRTTYLPSYGEYDTFDEFKGLCVSVFTEEYFEDLNHQGSRYSAFIDHNDMLYYIDAARGSRFGYAPDEFPDEYELVEMSDEVIVFNVTGHYKSSNVKPDFTLAEETFPVKMVLTENGWRFAKFADAGLDELPLPEDSAESVSDEIIAYTLDLAKYFRDPITSAADLREHQSLWEFLVNSIYALHEKEIVTLREVTEKEYYPQYYVPYIYMHKAAELLLGVENGLPEKLMSEEYHWLKDQDAFLYSPFSPPMYVTECIHSEIDVDGTIYVTIKISRIEEKEALTVNTYILKPVDDPEFGKLYQLLSITGEEFSPLMKDHSERISLYCSTEDIPHSAKHFRMNFGKHEAYISPKIGALISITWPPELYCMDIAVPNMPADGIEDAIVILTTGTGTGVHSEEAYVLSGADGTLHSFIEPYTVIENAVSRDKDGKTWIVDASGNRMDLPDNAYFNQNYKFYMEDGCLYAKVLIGYDIWQYTEDDFVIHYASSGATWKYIYADPNHGKSIDSSITDLLAMPAGELRKTYGPMTLAWSEAGPGQPVYQLGGKYGVYTVYYATDMNETIPDNRCADEIIVRKPYSDGDVCGLFIGDYIHESTAGIYWTDASYSVINGHILLSTNIGGYILELVLGITSEQGAQLPNEAAATAEEWAAWESAFIKFPFGKISSMRIRKEINVQASEFTNTPTLSIPHTSLSTEMEQIEENELFPAEKYSINVTGMSVPVTLYMQLDSVAAIEAHGQYVEIKELFDIYGNCSFELFESGGAVVIEGGYYEIGDVYILSPERCSEMHQGIGSSYWLYLDDSGSLKYLHKHNGIASIIQAGALNAAVAYDEFLFASGDASIKNGELFFAEPAESYTMSDRYDLDKEFRDLWSDEYSSIEEIFARNLSARNVQQYGQGPFIGYVADKETPWIQLYTSKTGTYVGRIPYEIFHDWVATDRNSEWWTPGWEPEYIHFYYAEFGDFRWAAAHLTDTTMGNGRKNVATSSDGGKTWDVGSTMDDYGGNHVVGMYFVSDKVAFMSFDPNNMRELIDGPEISRTTDGGKTWKRLVVSVPESLKGKKLLAGTPIHEGNVIRYPIWHNPAHGVIEGETMYIVSRDNGMTWEWEAWSSVDREEVEEINREDAEPNVPFSPEEYISEIRKLTGKNVLFWHKIMVNPVYLYFTPIEPFAKEFTVYSYTDYSMVTNREGEGLRTLTFALPAEIPFDSAEPVWVGGGGGSGECQFIVRLTSGSDITYVSYNNFHYTDELLDFTYAGKVSEDELISFAADCPEKFPGIPLLPHHLVLENQFVLYDIPTKKEMLLTDWLKNNEMSVSKYSVTDLDRDAYPETVLWLTRGTNEYVGFLILHSESEKVYAHLLYYRQFSNLKEDGTFHFSGGVANGGIGEIRFHGDSYTIQKLAYRESADNQNVFYFVDSKSVSRDAFDAFVNEQDQKPDAVWYEWNADQEEPSAPVLDLSVVDGQWYHSFRHEGWYAFYGLNIRSKTAEMQFDHGLYESEYANRYSGSYTVDPASQEITAVLHDGSTMHNDPNISLKFTIEVQTDGNSSTLVMNILSCDVPKYRHLVGQSLIFTREFGYADLQYQDAQDYYQMWYDNELTAEELLGKGAVITNIVETIKTTTGIDLYATHFIYEYHPEEDRFPFRFLITDETGTKMIETIIIRYKDETDGIVKFTVEVNPTVITVE